MSTTYYGALQESFSLDSDGGANYVIPIELPPGTGKMQPNISIGYNSGGGNGLLGMGFQLLGLSEITRVKATPAQDGFHGTINFDENDRFALDGVRLMLVSGSSYNSVDAVYRTEIESWRKVVPQYASSDTSNGPQSFLAYTHDGTTLQFGGGTGGSVTSVANSSIVKSWSLTKATDRNGNYLTAAYDFDANDSANYPSTVNYTANDATGLSAQRQVKFSYQTRADIVPQYQGGEMSQTSRLLQNIQTYVSNSLVRTYTCAYAQGQATKRTQLQSLTLSDPQGNNYPPTTFGWQDTPGGTFATTPSGTPANAAYVGNYYSADLDGDGFVDILNVSESGGKVLLRAWFSDGTGFSSNPVTVTTSVPYYSGQFILLDANADGAMDLVYAYDASGKLSLTTFISSGQGSNWTMTPGTTGAAGPQNITYGNLYAMDVDGDGLSDLVCVTEKNSKLALTTLYSNGSTFAPSSTDNTSPTVAYFSAAQIMPLDSNGNGMSDLLYAYHNGSTFDFILYASNSRNGFTEQQSIISSGTVAATGILMASDFNGDGIDDIVQAYISNGQLAIQTIVANGRSLTVPTVQTFSIGSLGTNIPILLPMEVNGDGLPDLVCVVRNGGNLSVTVFASNGTNYTQVSNVTQPTGIALGTSMPPILPMDFNGDGRTDLVVLTESSNNLVVTPISCLSPSPDLMTTITNGLGGQYTLDYRPLTDSSVYSESGTGLNSSVEVRGVFSTKVSGASYQVSNASPTQATSGASYTTRRVDFPKYVVAGYTKSDGRGNSYQYSQFYDTAMMDLTGRGWLGFASILSTDHSTGTINEVSYGQVFPMAHNVLSTRLMQAKNGVPSALMQTTALAYTPVPNTISQGQVYQVRSTSSQSDYYTFAPLTGATPDCTLLKAMSNFDDFGNPQLISQTGSAVASELYVFKQYQNDVTKWRIGFETGTKATSDSAGNNILSWQQVQFDTNMNVLNSQAWHDQTNRFLTTQYTYDGCGNPLTITSPIGNVTTMTYDAAHMTFLATKSTPGAAGTTLKTTGAYYPQNGEMQWFIDENGVKTSQDIDGLGQVIGKNGPDPSGKLIPGLTQIWGKDSTGTYVQVTSLIEWTGATTWSKQYVDGFSRSYRKQVLGSDGKTSVNTDQTFDSNDNAVITSLPYFDGANSQPGYKTLYDEYKRAVQITEPSPVDDGSSVTTLIAYQSTNNVLVTRAFGTSNAVQTTFEYAFSQGKQVLVKRTDNATGGNTSYFYDGTGRMNQVIDASGVTSKTTYDTTGRPTSFTSLNGSATLWQTTSTYDDVKGINTSKDAKGNTITIQNDGQGRMLTKAVTSVDTSSTETITFTYDSPQSALSLNRLSNVSSTNGSSYKFDYDSYGNQAGISLTVDGKTWGFQQTYKPTNELASRTYPDNSVETNAFTTGGLIASISLANSAADPAKQLIGFDGYTNLGLPQTITYGNGTSEAIGFSAIGLPKTLGINAPNSTTVYAATLAQNELGSLASSVEKVSNTNLSFHYDGTERINTVNGTLSGTYQFDNGGNVATKDGITFTGSGNQVTSGIQSGTTVYQASFDDAGNVSSATRNGSSVKYTYDGENRLVTAGSTTFLYDYSGRRIKKQVQGGPTVFSVSPTYQVVLFADGSEQHSKILCGKTGAAVSVTTVDSGTPVPYKGIAAPGVFYNHTDQLGSTIRQTDSNGNVTATVLYDAFGSVSSSTGSSSIPAMFTGKEWDDSTGLYYFGARYYDPISARFLTADDRTGGPLAERDVFNPYAYCLNNPVNYVDPLGHNVFSGITHDWHKVEHGFSKFGQDVNHLVHNRVFQLAFSYTVDGLLVVGGSVLLGLGFGTIGTTLLSAGVMGLIYDVQVTVKHQKFSWKTWGEQLAIGAVTGAIAGGVATGAGMMADSLADGVTDSVFNVGRVGRVLLNIGAGAIGGGGGNVGGQLLTNEFDGASLKTGLGFAAVSGFVIGGLGSAIGEGATRGLSREPGDELQWHNDETAKKMTTEGNKYKVEPYVWQRIVQNSAPAKFLLFLPGYVADWVGFGVNATGAFKPKWIPSW